MNLSAHFSVLRSFRSDILLHRSGAPLISRTSFFFLFGWLFFIFFPVIHLLQNSLLLLCLPFLFHFLFAVHSALFPAFL